MARFGRDSDRFAGWTLLLDQLGARQKRLLGYAVPAAVFTEIYVIFVPQLILQLETTEYDSDSMISSIQREMTK